MPDHRFVYCLGIRVRSGTNYLSKILSCHPDIRMIPPGRTTEEFPLLATLERWREAFAEVQRRATTYNGRNEIFDFEAYLRFLGESWERFVLAQYPCPPGVVAMKYPGVENLPSFFSVFPRAKLVILVRDGRDNVASCIKAGLHRRSSARLRHVVRGRINNALWRDFVGHTREWAAGAKQILEFERRCANSAHAADYLIVKYEDLVEVPRETSARIFSFIGLPSTPELLDRIADVDVVGSSFFSTVSTGIGETINWQPVPKSVDFRPVGRWQEWGRLRRAVFRRLAGRELVALGYS